VTSDTSSHICAVVPLFTNFQFIHVADEEYTYMYMYMCQYCVMFAISAYVCEMVLNMSLILVHYLKLLLHLIDFTSGMFVTFLMFQCPVSYLSDIVLCSSCYILGDKILSLFTTVSSFFAFFYGI